MTHLLVTNDFPPKVGGIQAYLWELWRRFDQASHPLERVTFDATNRRCDPRRPQESGP